MTGLCEDCIYFSQSAGSCTRFPKWEPVAKNHFCGEQKQSLAQGYWSGEKELPSMPIGNVWEHRNENATKMYYNEIRKARLLEKELAALRKAYREQTGKIYRGKKP